MQNIKEQPPKLSEKNENDSTILDNDFLKRIKEKYMRDSLQYDEIVSNSESNKLRDSIS
jgi:hypothetical protein